MKKPVTFGVQEDCVGCTRRSEDFFCALPDTGVREFSLHKVKHAYAKGTTLFIEGQRANGVYVLCAGRVKLSTYSEEGRSLIMRVAEPGEVLGLSACVAGVPHECSAQVIVDCQVNFVGRTEFLELLKNNSHAALNAIRDLSHLYHKAHAQICSLGLSASASDKLAKLLLDWCSNYGDSGTGVHVHMSYTHAEVAEMIGTSRETVTRMFKLLKDRGLIRLVGADLFVPDISRLRGTVGRETVAERCNVV